LPAQSATRGPPPPAQRLKTRTPPVILPATLGHRSGGFCAAATTSDHDRPAADFIARWQPSGGRERANYQIFLSELCDLLGVPRPDPTREDDRDNAYVFERTVRFDHNDGTHTTGRIDPYKRGCFVLEARQGSAAIFIAWPPRRCGFRRR
jgi:hypothetical protein